MKNHTRYRLIALAMVLVLLITGVPKLNNFAKEAYAENVTYGYVDVTSTLNVRKGAGTTYGLLTDSNGKSITLHPNQKVTILSTSGGWFKISFLYNGTDYTGYVSSSYVNVYDGTYDEAYAAELKEAGFPDSYIPALCYLHSKHPDWVFTPYDTGLDWTDAVNAESKLGVSLIQNTAISSWLSTESGAYNWLTDKYTVFDSSTWVAASKELVAFYLDPRNFLSENGIFMFEKLTYHSDYHTEDGVRNILNGTFMEGTYDGTNTYAALFMEAGIASGVSPYMLAARVKQEQGTTGKSSLISGTYPGYEGYYNYFNFGAYGTTSTNVIVNGLKYASKTDAATLRPWNSRYKSIMGGSISLGNQYINKGQDTLYLQRFNVTPTNTYGHQYMTNIQAAASEASHQKAAYTNIELPIEFSIPVFNNMPEEAVGRPTGYGNPNSYLSSLTISSGTLTPSFLYNTTGYSAVVGSDVSSVTISATAVSDKAEVTGTGTKTLNYGNNVFDIIVTAENGTQTNYRVTINRPQPGTTVTPAPVVTNTPTPTPTVTKKPTPTVIKKPTATVTKKPTATVTKKPTATPSKTAESVTSSNYTVKTGHIIHIVPGTTVSEFLSGVTVKGSSSKKVVDSSGAAQSNGTVVATGFVLKTDGLSYTLCVDGDIYGDGKVNVKDLLYIKKNLLGSQTLSVAQTYAACVSGSDKPTVKDLLMVKKYLLGNISDFK